MDDLVTFQFTVSGMTRASCAARVEQALQKVDGVGTVHVDFADQQACLQAPRGSLYALLDAVHSAGYGVPEDALELSIGGMTWASCVGRVERALGDVPAVKGARVDLATERALVKTCGTVDLAALIAAAAKTGYSASLVNTARGCVPYLYLDASAAVTTLVLLGKYLNGRVKRHPH